MGFEKIIKDFKIEIVILFSWYNSKRIRLSNYKTVWNYRDDIDDELSLRVWLD